MRLTRRCLLPFFDYSPLGFGIVEDTTHQNHSLSRLAASANVIHTSLPYCDAVIKTVTLARRKQRFWRGTPFCIANETSNVWQIIMQRLTPSFVGDPEIRWGWFLYGLNKRQRHDRGYGKNVRNVSLFTRFEIMKIT